MDKGIKYVESFAILCFFARQFSSLSYVKQLRFYLMLYFVLFLALVKTYNEKIGMWILMFLIMR